ncbi:unnamed protein product [Linum tenue]|uniref:Wings apart-like protein C-terminal domain-containing protein n=1 Tax=Linum tenue TaxID=586396 RepID=A0AAV0JBV0_9ROSI|nr:unnamed protein product [Linum tenue]
MIVRTYGRRSRSFSDSPDDDDDLAGHAFGGDSFSLSQESPSQDFYDFPFPSQESSSFWPSAASSSFDPDPYGFNPSSSQENSAPANGVASRKSKKPRNGELEKRGGGDARPWVPMTSTLMEAQEFGEMMEHVDEVNFALDGLRRGQPVRIRRASLLSLLSICGTVQQRRLLRAQGTVKTIIDAVLGLSFDDVPSNLAASTLFFLLTSDGQDDHMLESPSCILFLLQLLKPVHSKASQDKTRSLGSKILSIRRDTNILRDTSKMADSSSSAIVAKVEEILVSGKVIKSQSGNNMGAERPELTSKYIALLTMEKACLSKISLEDTSGRVRKMDGNFKEKLRELGGLDAVFEVAMSCHSAIESLEQQNSSSSQSAQDVLVLPSLVTLLKCLKIMENATFLSKDNQDHLLAMKRNSDSHGCRISFTKLVISVIKILSGLYLLRTSATSGNGSPFTLSSGSNNDHKVDSDGVICISSSESDCYITEGTSLEKGSQTSHKSIAQRVLSVSREAATMDDSNLLKMRVRSSMFSSSSETSRSCNGLRSKYDVDVDDSAKDSMCELFDSQDPFAFDGDDFEPSKWDAKYGKPKKSRIPAMRKPVKERRNHEDPFDVMTIQSESSKQLNEDSSKQQCSSQKGSNSSVSDEECSTLLSECLLTSVKVLMNLTNENPVGCRQVAGCKGLETMSSLIADHFPSFDSSSTSINSAVLEHQNEGRLTDQELDFLVAILGLLVNLVEKDGQNRSRLASASVSLASSQGSEEESRRDVIPLLCSIFLAHLGEGDQSEQGNGIQWDDEVALLEGEKEAEKMIVEAYAALLLAFLSTESKSTRDSIADCLPDHKLSVLVPVLERFVAFHLTLNMISPETHEVVKEVIESCRLP